MFSQKNKDHSKRLRRKRFFALSLSSILITASSAIFQSLPARAGGVSLTASPTSRAINQGESAAYTININRDGYAANVTLSASNLPANAAATFSPNPTTGKSSVLTVATNGSTPAGTFQIKVSGAASGITIASINVTLIVKSAPNVVVDGFPSTQSIIAGQRTDYSIKLTRTNYDGPITLEAKKMPDGLTASFEPNPVYGNSSTMRIYSHLLPFIGRDYDFIVSIREFQMSYVPLRLRVNCGISWAEQFGWIDPLIPNSSDFARSVAVAGDGSIYVAGDSFNPDNNSFDVWVAKYNASGIQQWFTPFRTAAEDRATEIAVDNNGGVFLGGYTAGAFPGHNNRGNFDFWIAKADTQGILQWISQGGTVGQDGFAGFEILPDNAGGGKFITSTDERNRISTYTFTSSGALAQQNSFPLVIDYQVQDFDIADISAGPNETVYVVGNLQSLFSSEGWVVKYNNQLNRNNRLWSQSVSFESATRVVVDSAGYAYVSGSDNGNGTGVDAWVAKFNPNYSPNPGNNPVNFNPPLWTATETSLAEDKIDALALDGSGDLITAGMTRGVLGEKNGDNPPTDDAWVARRNGGSGDLKWVKQFPVANIDGFNAVTVDGSDLILAGYTVAFKSNIAFEDALLMRYADDWTLFSPVVSSTNAFNPSSGQAGAVIRINGGNFFGITGVRFNGVPAAFTVVSSNAIDATVPPGATDGVVTASKDCASASSSATFDVLP